MEEKNAVSQQPFHRVDMADGHRALPVATVFAECILLPGERSFHLGFFQITTNSPAPCNSGQAAVKMASSGFASLRTYLGDIYLASRDPAGLLGTLQYRRRMIHCRTR